MIETNKHPIALVLSGGGALGAAHVGAVRALAEKYSHNYYVGTSAGAIVAAALACGLNTSEISKYLKDKSLLKVAFDFSFGGSGLIRGKKVLELLRRIYRDMNFEDLPKNVSLTVCATDFNSGQEVFLNKGSIAEAVRASSSVPGLFEPIWINGQPLVDGGLTVNLPLGYAIKNYQGEKIIAIDVCTSFAKVFPPLGKKKASLRQIIERSARIMFLQQQRSIPDDKRVTIVRPQLEQHTAVDILSLQKIEDLGYQEIQMLFEK